MAAIETGALPPHLPEIVKNNPAFTRVVDLLEQWWAPFEQLEQKFGVRASFTTTFDFEQLTQMTEAWTGLVKALPSTKESRLQLAKLCVGQLTELGNNHLIKPNEVQITQEVINGYKVLLALLMNDRTVPSALNVTYQELNLDRTFVSSLLKTATSMVLVLNKDCLDPNFLTKKVSQEKKRTSERWENEILSKVLGLMKHEKPGLFGYTSLHEKSRQQKAAEEIFWLQSLAEQVRLGRTALKSVKIVMDQFPRDKTKINSIIIVNETPLKVEGTMVISASLRDATFSEAQHSFGISDKRLFDTYELSVDHETNQPVIRKSNAGMDVAVYTQNVACDQLTHEQLDNLEQQSESAKKVLETKKHLPFTVAVQVEHLKTETAFIGPQEKERMLLRATDAYKAYEPFLEVNHTAVNFEVYSLGDAIGLKVDTDLNLKELGSSVLPTPPAKATFSFAPLTNPLSRTTVIETEIPAETEAVYIIYSLAGNKVVLSLSDYEYLLSSSSYTVLLTNENSFPEERKDLDILHRFLGERLNAENAHDVVTQYKQEILTADLKAGVKKALLDAINSYVRSQIT